MLSHHRTKKGFHAALQSLFLNSFFVRYQDIQQEKREHTCEDHFPEGGGEGGEGEERDGVLRQAATNRGKKGEKGEDGG